jgi:two-component system, chemotaxis family, sensor kinase CheA
VTTDGIPESVIARFRALSLERVARVESAWNAVFQGGDDPIAVQQMMRDVHTLKGDARVVGYNDVHVLAHQLEELLTAARDHAFQVSDEFELVITMSLQFLGMLLRVKPGGAATGLDLGGFLTQAEAVLRESSSNHPRRRPSQMMRAIAAPAVEHISDEARLRIAATATLAHLEWLSAAGETSRVRLRAIWDGLRDELRRLRSAELAPVLERHAQVGMTLAEQLGKRVTIEIALDGLRIDPRAGEAIEVAVLHALRNAVDHGIELPADRAAAGKPPAGALRVGWRASASAIHVSITDDGAGVDLAAVRERAVAAGLLAAGSAALATPAELHELLFHAGFSTRVQANEVSGRGVGLDAVRSALAKVGGSARVDSVPGRGTTVVASLPVPPRTMHVYRFRAPVDDVWFAVPGRWSPTVDRSLTATAIEPMLAVRLVRGLGRQRDMDLAQSGGAPLVLALRWNFLELRVAAGTEPALVLADRICQTSDDHAVEIVSAEGRETVLLRPELFGAGGASSSRG